MRARLVLFLLLAGCHRPIALGHHELPGFAIDLPRMLETRTSKLDYKVGQLTLGGMYRGSPLVTSLRWTPGEKLTPEQLSFSQAALTSATPGGASAVVNGMVDAQAHAVDTIIDRAPDHVLLLSQITCGGRNLIVSTLHDTDQTALHKRIIATLACHPDLEQEALLNQTTVPLALELPGWHAMSRDQNQLMLSSADGSSIVMLEPTVDKADLLDSVGPVVTNAFGGKVTAGKRDGDRVPMSGAIDGQALVGYVRVATCPSTSVLEMVMSSTKADAEAIDAKLKAATCLPPGSKPPVWPDAPKP